MFDRTPRGRVATPRAYEYFGLAAQGRIGCGEAATCEDLGLSTYVPPKLLTNADLEKLVETSNEWILQRTGIKQRHIVEPGVATSDLAKEAAEGAMRQAGVTADQIGFIVVGTTTPDTIFQLPRLPRAAPRSARPTPGASTSAPPVPASPTH